ncbi:hypothetical protein EDB89DRAFT_1928507 [Lactarius sanguifluus]|nr:hypothetical protein EDB89DRAFT_1928507 [Lactarius sanguifluus]
MRTPINFVWGAQSWLFVALSFAMCQSYISAVPLLRPTSCNETYLRKTKAQVISECQVHSSCHPRRNLIQDRLLQKICFVLRALAPGVTVHVNDSTHRQES